LLLRIEENGSDFYNMPSGFPEKKRQKTICSVGSGGSAHKKIFEKIFAKMEKNSPFEIMRGNTALTCVPMLITI